MRYSITETHHHFPPKQVFSRSVLSPAQFWLTEVSSLPEFRELMAEIDIPIDTNVMVFSRNHSDIWDIFDVYRPSPSSKIK